eukprot:Skav235864  [mRNA]  locus=scaffold1693:331360:332196:- [translate_table: standard]
MFHVSPPPQGMLWPFMPPETRSSWQAECCVEKNILRGSEREAMCESVLPKKTAIAFTQQDLNATDMGIASYVGENEKLVWTAKGVASILGELGWAVEGKEIDNSFLRWQPLSVQEGLHNKYWKVLKKEPDKQDQVKKKNKKKKPSFLQSWQGNDLCNHKTTASCTPAMQAWQQHACQDAKGWRFLAKEEMDDDCRPHYAELVAVETWQDCLKETAADAPAVFAFADDNEKHPINCFLYKEDLEECKSDMKKNAKPLLGNSGDVDFKALLFLKFRELEG